MVGFLIGITTIIMGSTHVAAALGGFGRVCKCRFKTAYLYAPVSTPHFNILEAYHLLALSGLLA